MKEETEKFLSMFKHLKELNEFNNVDSLRKNIDISILGLISILEELVSNKIMIKKIRGINKKDEIVFYDDLNDYYEADARDGNWVFKIIPPLTIEENW